jgi:hypothetical protein
MLGGRTMARTWDPMIKSRRLMFQLDGSHRNSMRDHGVSRHLVEPLSD